MPKILVHPIGAVIDTCATTYHELSLSFLDDQGYYFSDAPTGPRRFGPLPFDGEVYLRQQSPLSSAIESLVSDDPIRVCVNKKGQGAIRLAVPVPKGVEMVLKEIVFADAGPVHGHSCVTINGHGPIPYTRCRGSNTAMIHYPLRRFETSLLFEGCPRITEAVIYLVAASPCAALPLFVPSLQPIDIKRFFPHRVEAFCRFGDDTYRWSPSMHQRPCAIELPSGYQHWKLLVHANDTDIAVGVVSGVARVDVERCISQLILVPPAPIPADSVAVVVCFRVCTD